MRTIQITKKQLVRIYPAVPQKYPVHFMEQFQLVGNFRLWVIWKILLGASPAMLEKKSPDPFEPGG